MVETKSSIHLDVEIYGLIAISITPERIIVAIKMSTMSLFVIREGSKNESFQTLMFLGVALNGSS